MPIHTILLPDHLLFVKEHWQQTWNNTTINAIGKRFSYCDIGTRREINLLLASSPSRCIHSGSKQTKCSQSVLLGSDRKDNTTQTALSHRNIKAIWLIDRHEKMAALRPLHRPKSLPGSFCPFWWQSSWWWFLSFCLWKPRFPAR